MPSVTKSNGTPALARPSCDNSLVVDIQLVYIHHMSDEQEVTPQDLIDRAPSINWRSPITINGHPFGCRICIATKGIKYEDLKEMPKTAEDFARHMAFAHNLIAIIP